MCSHSLRRALAGSALLATLALGLAAPALAHEQRTLGTYSVEVGLIAEPVYTGDRSGLELIVTKLDEAPAPGGASPDPAASPAPVAEEPSGTPVTGLESTIQAEVIFGDHKRAADHGSRGRARRLRVGVHPHRRRPVHLPPHRRHRDHAHR